MVNKVQKKLKKFVEEQGDWMRRASFKNWIFIGVLFVLSLIIVLSRDNSVLAIAVSIGLVHFLVTKNLTSAMMSGAIVGILVLLYLRYKTDEMYKNRENANKDGVSGAIDDTVVTDEEEAKKDGSKKLVVKGDPNGELYVELPKHDHKEDTTTPTTTTSTTTVPTTTTPTTTTSTTTKALDDVNSNDNTSTGEEETTIPESTIPTTTTPTTISGFTGKRVVGAETCCSTPAPVK